ncbi:hypothetical protein ACJMK2_016027 [Sinanodonta woodiana]|uniref:Uncharacterized protein n=1 Tax=Sinanodonta woodiana TaxID=1069815 RepID=A0ABD3USB0_SINWO
MGIFDTMIRHSLLVQLMLHETPQLGDTLHASNVAIQHCQNELLGTEVWTTKTSSLDSSNTCMVSLTSDVDDILKKSISNMLGTVTRAKKRETIVQARAITEDKLLHQAGADKNKKRMKQMKKWKEERLM